MPSRNTRDLSAFTRDLARELTPPLMALWNRIEVMLAELGSDGPLANTPDDLEMLRRQAVRIVAIVKGLLCISGEPVFEIRPIDLNAIVEESLSPIIPRLARRQVEIEPLFDRTIPPVLADAEALRYVLTNLVESAAETMTMIQVTTHRVREDGARVTVGTNRLTQAEREISPDDGLGVVLADAMVRSLGGTLHRRGGNPAVTYAVSLRVAG